ncbi:MAG: ATP synthase F1 subunit gamma [Bacteriovoracaceae bacterium]|nr:ATP synthase F1 subunit gamma [Bacteriovoracaceae bacterium]
MANIKDLKKKIKSTKGTFKITSAMKLVSAAKLGRAQNAINNARPYANELEETIKVVSALVQKYEHSYLEAKDSKKAILLIVSANKGLCGGYNTQLARKVSAFVDECGLDLDIFFIGKKVRDTLKDKISGETFELEGNEPTFDDIKKIAAELASKYEEGEVGKVLIAYNIFKSAISFIPTVKQLLPMTLDESEKEKLQHLYPFDFKYDPSPEVILDTLIPETYVNTIYTCILDAVAAEHGSRMAAMDSAVSNCKDAIKTLTLKMNKLRQAAITTELIEVVSGAESLNG